MKVIKRAFRQVMFFHLSDNDHQADGDWSEWANQGDRSMTAELGDGVRKEKSPHLPPTHLLWPEPENEYQNKRDLL